MKYTYIFGRDIELITPAEEGHISENILDTIDYIMDRLGGAEVFAAKGDVDAARDCLEAAVAYIEDVLENPAATGFDKLAFANHTIDQFEKVRLIDAIKHKWFAQEKIPQYIGRITAARDAVAQPIVVSHPEPIPV